MSYPEYIINIPTGIMMIVAGFIIFAIGLFGSFYIVDRNKWYSNFAFLFFIAGLLLGGGLLIQGDAVIRYVKIVKMFQDARNSAR